MIGDLRLAPNLPARFQAAHAGHVHVEQDEIEPVLADLLQRLFAARRIVHFVALAGQRDAHDPPDLRIVVDDEDLAGAHGRPSCGSESVNVVPAA